MQKTTARQHPFSQHVLVGQSEEVSHSKPTAQLPLWLMEKLSFLVGQVENLLADLLRTRT